MLFICELIDKGVVKERFLRHGESAKQVKEGLELFEWGPGEWRISVPEDDEE